MSEKIVVNKLTKYYGKFKALSNVSFNVNQGEVFGLIGPNGAGKSTTMRSMLNFIFPSNGSITINGLDSKKDYLKIRSLIGYLPGEFTTYENMTGQEYLKHILHLRKIPKKRCVSCKRVCVWDDERHPVKDFMPYRPFVLCTYCHNFLFSCYIH